MNQRNKYIFQIIISLLVCIICVFFYIIESTKNIQEENNAKKESIIKGDDIVSEILRNIDLGKIEKALENINELNENIPKEVKEYFINFTKTYNKSIKLDTNKFIKNSKDLEQYFSEDKQRLDKISVIPYFLIKEFNSKNRKQKNEIAVYREYIDNFVKIKKYLNKKDANIICLYIYSCYDATDKDFEYLLKEVEDFIKKHEDSLGDNGYLSIQKKYLQEFKTNLEHNKTRKPNIIGIIKDCFSSVLEVSEAPNKLINESVMYRYPRQYL